MKAFLGVYGMWILMALILAASFVAYVWSPRDGMLGEDERAEEAMAASRDGYSHDGHRAA